MKAVEVSDLVVRYNGTPVLENVSFEIKKGDFIGIVGPNGCGKTTLAKAILGLVKPVRGSIQVLGQNQHGFRDWGKIGYLPQVSKSLHRGFPANVREIVATGLLAQKTFPKRLNRNDQKAVDEALDLLRIGPIATKMIGQISGGQQQRVFLARALVSKPEVLIMDEPTVALDPETRSRFYETITELNREQGVTILLITHDSGSIGQYADKMLYLDRRVIFYGSFEEFCHSTDMSEYFGESAQHVICHRH